MIKQWLTVPGGVTGFDLPKRGKDYHLLALSFYVDCTSDVVDRWPRLVLYLSADGAAISPIVTHGKLVADDVALVIFATRSGETNTPAQALDAGAPRIIVTGELPQNGLFVSTSCTLSLLLSQFDDAASNIVALIQECE